MPVQRDTHPPADILKAFGLGKLDDRSADVVRKHLDQCEGCRKEVTALSGDDFLNRRRPAQHRSATPAPSNTLTTADPRPKPPLGPTTRFNLPPELADNPQYEIRRELGRGGMGVVYLAKNKLMDRLEVLKVINKSLLDRPGALQRFLREIRSAAKLNHANVVTAYSALQMGNLLVFAMEYVEGQDLAAVVKVNGPLAVPHACFYIQQAAWGLQHAFEKGMVHRDIKPQNLVLALEGRKHVVKVLDFGLAKATQEKGDDTSLTAEGNMLGTPDYVAPEQICDAASADIRADIYSLGCTLYFLLSGQRPFKGKNLFEVMQAHQTLTATALNQLRPDVPAELAAVVRKMMAKDRAERYQTPLEVVQALGPFVKQGGASSSSSQLPFATAAPKAERAEQPPAPAAPAADWSSLTQGSSTAARPHEKEVVHLRRSAVGGTASKKGWLIGGCVGLAFGGLLLVLLVLWASGIFKVKTKSGTLVLEDLPADTEVLVDGETVSLKGGDGKTIIITAGKKHQLQVRKDGFSVFGKEVEIEAGDRRTIRVRLERPIAGSKPSSSEPVREPKRASPSAEGVVPLFNGKDLTGWEKIGKGDWLVEKGILRSHGQENPGYLATERDYGDFELAFEYRLAPKGNSGVFVHAWKEGALNGSQFLEIQLLDDEGYGTVEKNNGTAAIFGVMAAKPTVRSVPNTWHKLNIRAKGRQLQVSFEGRQVIDANLDDYQGVFQRFPGLKRTTGRIGLQHYGTSVEFRNLEIKELSRSKPRGQDFLPLFNGKDLTGWKTHPDAPGDWKVEDGILVGRGPKVSHLYSERGDYKNFHLLVEAKINQGGNSGILFHKAFTRDGKDGYEAQIDSSSHKFKTGTLYVKGYVSSSAGVGVEKVLVPVDTWYNHEVIVQGNRIIIKINGEKTADFVDTDNTWPPGHIVLQVFDKPTVVEFRRIEFKELK